MLFLLANKKRCSMPCTRLILSLRWDLFFTYDVFNAKCTKGFCSHAYKGQVNRCISACTLFFLSILVSLYVSTFTNACVCPSVCVLFCLFVCLFDHIVHKLPSSGEVKAERRPCLNSWLMSHPYEGVVDSVFVELSRSKLFTLQED